jgi:hypothetical protein
MEEMWRSLNDLKAQPDLGTNLINWLKCFAQYMSFERKEIFIQPLIICQFLLMEP